MSLKSIIEKINANYRNEILQAVKSADPAELLEALGINTSLTTAARAAGKVVKAPKAPRAASKPAAAKGSRVRRSAEAIDALLNDLVAAVKSSGDEGMSISAITSRLGVAKGDIGRPLAIALKDHFIRKVGDRRNAKYVAV